ncbi:histidinol dehydrogenase, partial [Candidatus Aerophobetes bacterium]|nr:histidinol dehydrogenase [Candidatus Aerophobetes bacterium]
MRAPVKLKDLSRSEYQSLINRFSLQFENIIPRIIPIVKEIKEKGDSALLHFTQQFDKVTLTKDSLIVSKDDIKKAYDTLPVSLIRALKKMQKQVEDFHRGELPEKWSLTKYTSNGQYTLGQKFSPVEKAAIYVPGGKASYPSTAIMGCVPAKLANVREIVVCSPPSADGKMRPEVMVAADIAGANLLVNAGGAQAIAALAYGTQSIPRVDIIAGPGNIYVTCAKAYLASLGKVGVDCLAGPSEVFILADDSATSLFIVWDMLSQAEHAEDAWSILVTDSDKLAWQVYDGIKKEIENAKRKNIICSSLEVNGFIIIIDDLKQGIDFANEFAPEHLEIITRDPDEILPHIKNAGSIFLGAFSPVAAGDYFTGTNHILPTGGAARFSSGLSVHSFLKRISYQKLSLRALASMEEPICHLARQEGLYAHLRSIQIRG